MDLGSVGPVQPFEFELRQASHADYIVTVTGVLVHCNKEHDLGSHVDVSIGTSDADVQEGVFFHQIELPAVYLLQVRATPHMT